MALSIGRAILGVPDPGQLGHPVATPAPTYNDGHMAVAQSQQEVRARGGEINYGPQRQVNASKDDQLALAQSNIVSATTTPQRMYIQSVDRLEEVVEAQFNPEKLKETIGVDWQRFLIPGLTYQPQQYANTNNIQYRFDLFFTAAATAAVRDVSGSGSGVAPTNAAASVLARNLAARDQLQAWSVLRKNDRLGGIGDTQRLLFVWPNFIAMTCNIVSAEFEYDQFNVEGLPVSFKVSILLEEVRDVAIYAEDVLAQGTIRSGRGQETV